MLYKKIRLPCKISRPVLAVGGQSKAGFCLAKGSSAYLSNLAGDLSDLGNFKKFEQDIKRLQKKLKIKPSIIACDMHPEYASSKYADDLVKGGGWKVEEIQHHEAHVASCIVDNNIEGKVIGVAFDGTGFGRDGNIWGGEFFVGGLKGFKRAAHLKYIPMPGGEACIREPKRMAFSYLYEMYKDDMRLLRQLRCLAMTDRCDIFRQMIDKKINSPLTSSVGRLFDGVSSLIGVCDVAKYEGEAAIKLEKEILVTSRRSQATGQYRFKYIDREDVVVIDWGPVIKGVIKDVRNKTRKADIALRFHNAVAGMIKDVCKMLRKRYKINKVCMSGGVFQNKYLSCAVKPLLEKEGFEGYLHKNIPAHDGGIALGQAVLAGV